MKVLVLLIPRLIIAEHVYVSLKRD
ncbi:protein of unknown function [Tenacibaculum aestuariivivum]